MESCWCYNYHLDQVECECCTRAHQKPNFSVSDIDAVLDENASMMDAMRPNRTAEPPRLDYIPRCDQRISQGSHICCRARNHPGIHMCSCGYPSVIERAAVPRPPRLYVNGQYMTVNQYRRSFRDDESIMVDEHPERWVENGEY